MPRISKKAPLAKAKKRVTSFMARRPHRTFRLTRRRDYKRSLKLPGYIAFTWSVNKTMWKYRRTFIWLAVVYAVLTTILVGIGSQETYSTLLSTLQNTGSDLFQGNLGQIGQAALLLVSISASGLAAAPTEGQQIYVVLIGLLVWLSVVWLLRNLLAGHKVKLRDGIYNAGAPIVPTFIVALIMVVQLIPLGLAIIAYSAASSTGLLSGGVAAMVFWFAAILLVVLSLYWVTSSFFAAIIATLPGMYPFKALKIAGDMAVGRRLRILLRILWMFGAIAVTSAVILIPIILIDTGLIHVWPAINTIPIVPVAVMLCGVAMFVWGAGYIYLLYRKVVDDDAKPA